MRRLLERKSSLVACILILIAAFTVAVVFAGDVVVKEGDISVGDITGTGVVNITGPNGVGQAAAPDVLVVTGGDGGSDLGGFNGGGISLITGNGGNGSIIVGGSGGNIELTTGAGGDGNPDGRYGNIILAKNGGNVGIGTQAISWPLVVDANVSGISIWSLARVSAAGYITRTSIYDESKGSALDWIKDASAYIDAVNKIDHSQFYGYVTYSATDYSRPEIQSYEYEGQTYSATIYPHQKVEEGVMVDEEIAVLRQAVYELKQEIQVLKDEIARLKEAVGIQ